MRANTVMPFAFTSASSLFIVSFRPCLLCSVVNPSAAIACTPHKHITAISPAFFTFVRRFALLTLLFVRNIGVALRNNQDRRFVISLSAAVKNKRHQTEPDSQRNNHPEHHRGVA